MSTTPTTLAPEAAVGVADNAGPPPRREPRRSQRLLVAGIVLLIVALLQRDQLGEFPDALAVVADADLRWAAAAAVGSALTYVFAAVAMIGAVHARLPFSQVLRVQVASAVSMLVAPPGLGAAGLNVWHLQRMGLARSEALLATARNALAGGLVHLSALVAVLLMLPELVDVDAELLVTWTRRISIGLLLAATAGLIATRRHRIRTALAARSREMLTSTRTLLRRPERRWPLFTGPLGITIAYGVTLWAGARAVGVPISLTTAFAIEITASALGAISAVPGGIGIVEAAGLQGLILAGLEPRTALATVLLHRLLTFWLPMLPGAVALRQLASGLPADAADTTDTTNRVDAAGAPVGTTG